MSASQPRFAFVTAPVAPSRHVAPILDGDEAAPGMRAAIVSRRTRGPAVLAAAER